jgi:hypothetical protein
MDFGDGTTAMNTVETSASDPWRRLKERMREAVGGVEYDRWFGDVDFSEDSTGELKLHVPRAYLGLWRVGNFIDELLSAGKAEHYSFSSVSIVCDEPPYSNSPMGCLKAISSAAASSLRRSQSYEDIWWNSDHESVPGLVRFSEWAVGEIDYLLRTLGWINTRAELNRTPSGPRTGRPSSRERDIRLALEFRRRRENGSRLSDTALKVDICTTEKLGLGRDGALKAINRGLKIVERENGRTKQIQKKLPPAE